MYQYKLIVGWDQFELESNTNDWLNQNSTIKILDIKTFTGDSGKIFCAITYKDV